MKWITHGTNPKTGSLSELCVGSRLAAEWRKQSKIFSYPQASRPINPSIVPGLAVPVRPLFEGSSGPCNVQGLLEVRMVLPVYRCARAVARNARGEGHRPGLRSAAHLIRALPEPQMQRPNTLMWQSMDLGRPKGAASRFIATSGSM